MRFTQDVPDAASIGPYYQAEAYISHTDSDKGLVNKLYKAARTYTLNWKMRLVNKFTGLSANGSLLDIGCGTGAFLHKAATSHMQATGLEPDAGARQVCKDKYGLEPQPPETLFQLPDASFDAITMWHVLEHVHQLHDYMDQLKRLLKPQGALFIAVPNPTSKDAQHYRQHWAAYDVPRHLYHFSPDSVQRLAAQHGMKVVATRPMWLDAFYIAMLSEQYQKGKTSLIAALWQGLRSNLHALRHKDTCSSLVYIIRHQ